MIRIPPPAGGEQQSGVDIYLFIQEYRSVEYCSVSDSITAPVHFIERTGETPTLPREHPFLLGFHLHL
jgi:hypothetical protein